MNALVTVTYRLSNICDATDLEQLGVTFDEMVRFLIREEGLLGLVDEIDVDKLIICQEFA